MQELWFLCSAHPLMLIDIYMKFREDSLNGFQVIEWTRVWQTDRQMPVGKACLPALKWGDIIKNMLNLIFCSKKYNKKNAFSNAVCFYFVTPG